MTLRLIRDPVRVLFHFFSQGHVVIPELEVDPWQMIAFENGCPVPPGEPGVERAACVLKNARSELRARSSSLNNG